MKADEGRALLPSEQGETAQWTDSGATGKSAETEGDVQAAFTQLLIDVDELIASGKARGWAND